MMPGSDKNGIGPESGTGIDILDVVDILMEMGLPTSVVRGILGENKVWLMCRMLASGGS